jgi:uncharacterized protein (TIGR00730 family)
MPRTPHYRTGDPDLDGAIRALIATHGSKRNADLLFEIVAAAMQLQRIADRGEMKIASGAIKELHHTFETFQPYRDARKASLFGSARTKFEDPLYQQTVDVAQRLAEHDWMIITGAGPGIMQAGLEGAGVDNSFGVAIDLPFESPATQVLAGDPKLVAFRYFFMRKLAFMKESSAFILLPGGFGTLDETFELLTLLHTGKGRPAPVVLLDTPDGNYWKRWLEFIQLEILDRRYISPDDLRLVRVTDDAGVAVEEILHFYSNFHSTRFVGGNLVVRLHRLPDEAQLAELNTKFKDIVVSGEIVPVEASREEIADEDVVDLPRLQFRFDRASYGPLRLLIDDLNSF